jgi:phosphatidylserine/phosphatidylglycerophosphate/cardiolipin synthase-like enzyme
LFIHIKGKYKRTHTLKHNFNRQENPINFGQTPKSWHPAIIAGHAIHAVNHVGNNTVEPLINGDTAYPEMIQSIDCAKRHIVLSSYIFDYDSLGHQFINALADAHQRGVIVNVLLDGIGIGISLCTNKRKNHDTLFYPRSNINDISSLCGVAWGVNQNHCAPAQRHSLY